MTVNTQQRTWDDVAVGDTLPSFQLHLTPTKMVEQVSGSQDFYPVHHDVGFAQSGGHPDIFYNTGFTRAALFRLLTDFVGDDGWVRNFQYAMRKMLRPGDVVTVAGKVTQSYVSDEDEGLLDIELWIETDRDGVATPATATVVLPRRTAGRS